MSRAPSIRTDTPGTIEAGVLYRVDEAQRRLGLGYDGWRSLRRAGLEARIRQIGGRGFVLGDDLLQVFRALPGREAT
jgi:hypothetical protein